MSVASCVTDRTLTAQDKVMYFWDITKGELAGCQAELRQSDRHMEEAEQEHQVETKVQQQVAQQ